MYKDRLNPAANAVTAPHSTPKTLRPNIPLAPLDLHIVQTGTLSTELAPHKPLRRSKGARNIRTEMTKWTTVVGH